MNLNEYAEHDGIGLAQLVASGDVRAEELAALAIEAVQQVNPSINAVIEHWTPTRDHRQRPIGRRAVPD